MYMLLKVRFEIGRLLLFGVGPRCQSVVRMVIYKKILDKLLMQNRQER